MHDLVISNRPPGDLRPYKDHARTHSKRQLEQLEAAVVAIGVINPILIDETCEIIAGHARWMVAKRLRLNSVPTIMISGLRNGQKRALRLADNKIAQNAGWDTELLKIELQNICEIELDMLPVIGFEPGEIEALLAPKSPDPDDDAIPAIPERAVTQLGDIWRLGDHLVACGDCRDKDLLQALMSGDLADAAFTDPPYNVAIDGFAGGKGKVRHREFAHASGEMTASEFTAFLRDALGASASVSRDGAVHFVCMDHRHIRELLDAAGEVYAAQLNLCVWNKSNAGMGSLYRSKHELVFVFRVGETQHLNTVELGKHGRSRTNIWDYPSVNTFGGSRQQDLALHPTVKPTSMVADAICDVTRRGDVVFDGFLGSGTSLIAAERVGRVFRGVEVDRLYVDLALMRWSVMTGQDPVLEETGESFEQVRKRRLAEGAEAQDEGVD